MCDSCRINNEITANSRYLPCFGIKGNTKCDNLNWGRVDKLLIKYMVFKIEKQTLFFSISLLSNMKNEQDSCTSK